MRCIHLPTELHYRWDQETKHLGGMESLLLFLQLVWNVISYLACQFTAMTFSSCSFQKETALAPKEDLTTIQSQVAPSSWSCFQLSVSWF